MSNTRYSVSRCLRFGLVGGLIGLFVAGNWVSAAPRRRAKARASTTRTVTRPVVRRLPSANLYSAGAEERMVRLRLVVAAGNGTRATLDIDQGVGRLMNHSDKMLETDIYLAAGKTYTFTYYFEDLENSAAYTSARTWLERDGMFLFDFAHERRKPGGKMAIYKRSVTIS